MSKDQKYVLPKHEETIYNHQFSLVLVEHLRLTSHVLRRRHATTLNEYCTLVFLAALTQKISSAQLSHYLLFKHGTLLAILASLEDQELIRKEVIPADRRAMFIYLTPQGNDTARALATEVSHLMNMTFWRSLPSSEYLAPLNELEAQMDGLRGHSMTEVPLSWTATGLTHALLFRIVHLIVSRWTRAVYEHSGLGYNECRVLLLLELFGSLRPSDIAQRLHSARSGISLILTHLYSLGLIELLPSSEDGRSKVCRCTTTGLRLARELLSVLRSTTLDAYQTYTDAAIMTLNSQHLRMYGDLHNVESTVQDILSE